MKVLVRVVLLLTMVVVLLMVMKKMYDEDLSLDAPRELVCVGDIPLQMTTHPFCARRGAFQRCVVASVDLLRVVHGIHRVGNCGRPGHTKRHCDAEVLLVGIVVAVHAHDADDPTHAATHRFAIAQSAERAVEAMDFSSSRDSFLGTKPIGGGRGILLLYGRGASAWFQEESSRECGVHSGRAWQNAHNVRFVPGCARQKNHISFLGTCASCVATCLLWTIKSLADVCGRHSALSQWIVEVGRPSWPWAH